MDTQENTKRGDFGAGGTPGGIGLFFLGFAMACAGGWLLTNQVVVSSDFFATGFMLPLVHYRMNSFGLALLPFIIGIGFLFFDGKSVIGWLLTVAGLGIILVGILMSLHIYFQPTSLFKYTGHARPPVRRTGTGLPLPQSHSCQGGREIQLASGVDGPASLLSAVPVG